MRKESHILLWGSNLWYLGEGMLGPLFAIFSQRVGGNILDVAWAWATYMFVTGFLMIVVGKLSDGKFRKEKLMVIGFALNAFFTFAYLFVRTPMHLFFVQAGLGVAAALAYPTWEALFAKYECKSTGGLVWGLANGEARILTGIAIVIGGLIVNYFSFQTLFIVMGCVETVATVYQARILRRSWL